MSLSYSCCRCTAPWRTHCSCIHAARIYACSIFAIIHHHLQTLLAPSLGKIEARLPRHSPCHCPASEQRFLPMALVCYLLPLHFGLTYYVMLPESTAKTTYKDLSCTVVAQALQIDEKLRPALSSKVGMLRMLS